MIKNKNKIPKEYSEEHYFNMETEKDLLNYINEKDPYKKEMIYREKLHSCLVKLVENIIHTFNFKSFFDTYDDLKNEVLSFLISKLDKFDPKISKAYTFLSIIAKRYLIILSQTNLKRINGREEVSVVDYEKSFLEEQISSSINGEMDDYYYFLIDYIENNINSMYKNQKDRKIALALLKIMKDSNNYEIENRKSLYMNLKSICEDANTTSITKVLNVIKSKNREIRRLYLQNKK